MDFAAVDNVLVKYLLFKAQLYLLFPSLFLAVLRWAPVPKYTLYFPGEFVPFVERWMCSSQFFCFLLLLIREMILYQQSHNGAI